MHGRHGDVHMKDVNISALTPKHPPPPRDAFEEMRKLDVCDMKEFGSQESREKNDRLPRR